jgi:hypothetical protein
LLPLSTESPSRHPDSSQPASLPTVEADRAVPQEASSVSTPEDAMARLDASWWSIVAGTCICYRRI